MKKYILQVLYTILTILISAFIITILYYFNITNENINKILIFISGIIAIFIGSLKFSIKNNIKALITGISFYSIFMIIFTIINVIFIKRLNLNTVIYYISLLIFSIIASYIGKNTKKEKN